MLVCVSLSPLLLWGVMGLQNTTAATDLLGEA